MSTEFTFETQDLSGEDPPEWAQRPRYYPAPSNQKYLCTECHWAAKGKCPQHPGKSLAMGTQWRPGKKGRKTRLWDNRMHGSITTPPPKKWQYRGYWNSPLGCPAQPPSGLVHLGAVNFSHNPTSLLWNDPVQKAIRAKNQKQPRPLSIPSSEPGWPFL